MKNNSKIFRLSGKKVFLRYPTAEDAEEFLRLSRASEKFHRGLIKWVREPEKFKAFLERAERTENESFFVCRATDARIAGLINLSQIFYGPLCSAYLGYGLGVKFTGEGLMTEAVALALRYAFKDLKLHRVEANVQPENGPSINVLRRNNFTKEGFSEKYLKIGGRWRDHERWAITKENWKSGR